MADEPGDNAPPAAGLPEPRVAFRNGLALFRRFWPFMRPELKAGILVTVLQLLAIPSGVISPLLLKKVFDEVVPGGDVTGFLVLGGIIAGLTILSHALGLAAGLVVLGLQTRVRHRLTRRLFDHVLRLRIGYFHGTETGYVMARVREDVQSLGALMLDSLAQAGIDALRAFIFFALLLTVDLGLALSGIALLVVIFGAVVLVSRPLRRRSEVAQEADAVASSALHQALSGVLTVKVCAAERREGRRFGRYLKGALRAFCGRDVLQITVTHLVGLAVSLGLYVIIVVGAYRILVGASTFGSLMAFAMYLTFIGGALSYLMSLNVQLQKAFASLERIFKLLDQPREAAHGPPPPPPLEGRVRFAEVSFRYGDDPAAEPALDRVSVAVDPGEVLAIVGRSGAGKSTLVNLLPRLHEPAAGRILLDGRPLASYPLGWLRERIGVVPQDVFLFNRTIEENIALARPEATRAEVEAAARTAHADRFIERLDRGYDTLVGERGVKLSGGEKQRIAIAREILRDPPILILDEATSSLDSESEALIKEAVERLKRHRTCFIIAHRLSTVLSADRILVLNHGRVVEVGSHAELLAHDGLYRKLYQAQFDVAVD